MFSRNTHAIGSIGKNDAAVLTPAEGLNASPLALSQPAGLSGIPIEDADITVTTGQILLEGDLPAVG